MKQMINIALPKGRLGEKAYGIFEKAGYECPSIREENRKLIFENEEKVVRYFWVKPSDVVIYVERGAADIGIAGKDIILEYSPDIYELAAKRLGLDCSECAVFEDGTSGMRSANAARAARVIGVWEQGLPSPLSHGVRVDAVYHDLCDWREILRSIGLLK